MVAGRWLSDRVHCLAAPLIYVQSIHGSLLDHHDPTVLPMTRRTEARWPHADVFVDYLRDYGKAQILAGKVMLNTTVLSITRAAAAPARPSGTAGTDPSVSADRARPLNHEAGHDSTDGAESDANSKCTPGLQPMGYGIVSSRIGLDFPGGPTTTLTLDGCISVCESFETCAAFSWKPPDSGKESDPGICHFKSGLADPVQIAGWTTYIHACPKFEPPGGSLETSPDPRGLHNPGNKIFETGFDPAGAGAGFELVFKVTSAPRVGPARGKLGRGAMGKLRCGIVVDATGLSVGNKPSNIAGIELATGWV